MKLIYIVPKILSFVVVFLFISGGMDAKAQQFSTASDMDADIVPRLSMNEAAFGISNQDKSVDLLLTDDAVVLQFTEDFLKGITEEIERSDKMTDSASFAQIFKEVISKSVHTFLDRAISIPFKEIEQISYEDGKIVIINKNNEELFNELEINNKQIMEDFSKRDARSFIAEAEKLMI